jgi:large subunit ribosomal protein L4
MSVAVYTKSGAKSAAKISLDKQIFGLEVKNHELLKKAYLAYLANSRTPSAKVKTRGLVRGGGAKPFRQKGTGRARVGSSRTPIWRGGGIIFGPTGYENHSIKISSQQKRLALRQALSLASQENRISIIDELTSADGKTSSTVELLKKIDGSKGRILLAVSSVDQKLMRATRNIKEAKLANINYLTVFDILNADKIIITKNALDSLNNWLGVKV